jgi:hypothetical protein
MNAYTQELIEMGIANTRAEGIANALATLNRELCDLDNSGLRIVGQKYGIIGHLDQYAKTTGARNVARDLYEIGLARAFKNIDLDEFPEFSDKLFYLAEEASEMNIPGATMLCKSLIDMRKAFESKKRPMAKFAAKMNHIGFINGPGYSQNLTVHIDGIYNSENRHLNDEEIVGSARHLKTYTHEDDRGESGTDYMFIAVDFHDFHYSRKTLFEAIKNTYHIDSCHHEYDCCACRRQTVQHIKFLADIQCDNIYAVKISWHLCV